jgi:hypothetical protein
LPRCTRRLVIDDSSTPAPKQDPAKEVPTIELICGYTVPVAALAKLGQMNKDLDPRGRFDAVMATDGLFDVQPAQ